jgi:hypothetical protein
MTVSRVPGTYSNVLDGNLQTLGSVAVGSRFITGVCSSGTVNAVRSFADPDEVLSPLGLGSGPGARAVHTQLVLGGGIVYFARAAGTAGSVVADVGNPVAPVVATTGSPLDAYDIQVKITKAGAVGTSTFKVSLDGGDSFSLETLTVASYPVPNTDLTLTFAVGAYVLDTVYKFTAIAPTATIAAVQDAVRAFLNTDYQAEYVQVAQPADAAMWAVLDALMLEAQTAKEYMFALTETIAPGSDPDAWTNARLLEKAAFSSPRVVICAAWGEVSDTISGREEIQSLAARIGARISSNPVQRKAARVRDGALAGVIAIAPFALDASGQRQTKINDGHTLALEKAGFLTVYNLKGAKGVFVQEDRTAALSTSDFALLPNLRVINKARGLLDQAWLKFVQDEIDLADLKTSLKSYIAAGAAALGAMRRDGEISDVTPKVVLKAGQTPATIIASSRVSFVCAVVPKGYSREITFDLGFFLPEGGN